MFSSALKSFSSNIAQNYVLSAQPTSSAGAWKVFDGKSKKTGKLVSVFVFDRKTLESGGGGFDNSRSSASTRRKVHDEVIERLKKEASFLARLRHPNILELAEPVEETRGGGLTFATEPITATLGGLLREQDNNDAGRTRSTRYRRDEDGEQKEMELDELEIQKGLLQVAKGLEFLHESAGMVHGNLTPEAIYINQKSDWKISALAFAGPPDDSSNTTTQSSAKPIALSELLYYDPRLPRAVQLDINYTSPDFVMDASVSAGADMFSLGLVMIALYNSPHESPLKTNNNLSSYKKLFSSSSTVPSSSNKFLSSKPLPPELQSDVLPRLITRRAAQRMSAREFQESSFFDNVLVNTIRFLDALPAKSANEKSQFMRGLPRVLEQFPKSVLQKKVLPALLEETKDKELLPLILADTFKIINILPSPQRVVTDRVLPKLQEIFQSPPTKANAAGASPERDTAKEAGLAVVLENLNLIADTCTGKEFKDFMLPIVVLGMESPAHSLVDKALRCLSIILKVLDFSTIKNELFPVVAAVFSRTSSLAIKIRGLEAFVILCGGANESETIEDESSGVKSRILDKYTVQEKIVPLMRAIKTKEPAVMMASLKVFQQISKIADVEFLATDVLPILWTFALGPLLSMQQFQQFMDLLRSTSSRIETEHTRKLRALAAESGSTTEATSASTNDLMSLPNDGPFSPSSSNVGEDDFTRLVLGRSGAAMGGSSQPVASNPFPPQSNTTSPALSPPTQTTKPLYDFGWSSQPLQPATSASRAITPDHTAQGMSAFPAIAPSNHSTGSRPSLQPTPSMSGVPNAFGNAQSDSWATGTSQQPQQSTANYNAWSNTSPPAHQSSGWSLPPPPGSSGAMVGRINGMGMSGNNATNQWPSTGSNGMNSMANSNVMGRGMGSGMAPTMGSGMGMGINANGMANKPGQQQQSTSWSQAPLPPQSQRQQQQQPQQQQNSQVQKSGLDKYESLI